MQILNLVTDDSISVSEDGTAVHGGCEIHLRQGSGPTLPVKRDNEGWYWVDCGGIKYLAIGATYLDRNSPIYLAQDTQEPSVFCIYADVDGADLDLIPTKANPGGNRGAEGEELNSYQLLEALRADPEFMQFAQTIGMLEKTDGNLSSEQCIWLVQVLETLPACDGQEPFAVKKVAGEKGYLEARA
ncbi:hypothetical protein ACTVZO_38925 [Streptomyces sp. IBSNAI002]|uniref:hypothetical protein n=1 Tax=Streptomyces sp. IBSNAI002 TaxID=3457500 RepID=UPI003FD6AA17